MADWPTTNGGDDDERLAALLAGFIDGTLSDAELDCWDEQLVQNDWLRELFVATCVQRELLGQRLPFAQDSSFTVEGSRPPQAPQTLGFFGAAIHGTVGYFSSGWPAAYLIATVIFGIGLLIGSHVYVSQPEQVASRSVLPSTSGRGAGGEGSENVTHSRPPLAGSRASSIAGLISVQKSPNLRISKSPNPWSSSATSSPSPPA